MNFVNSKFPHKNDAKYKTMLEFKVSSLVHTFSKIISLPRSWISTQNYRNKASSPQTSGCIYLYCPIADCDCIYVLYLIPSDSNFVHFYHSRNSFFQTTTKPLQYINSSRLSENLSSINSTFIYFQNSEQ